MRRVLLGTGAIAIASSAVPVFAQAVVGYDPVTNRSFYLDSTVRSWVDAHNAAVAAGGNLASIDRSAVNDLINAMSGNAWVGLTDSETYGGSELGNSANTEYAGQGWVWSDGSPMSYRNWAGGEPNNFGEEDFGNIRTDGGWNDLPASWTLSSVFQESRRLAGPVHNGHEYLLIPADTWTNAQATAQALGGNLAVINDAAENAFIDSLVDGAAWIGLNDEASEFGNTSALAYPAPGNTPSDEPGTQKGEGWIWVNGQPLVYQNWNTIEPNDSGGEDFAEITNGGLWNDLPGSVTRVAVVEIEPIPEPAALSLLGLAGLLALRRRRRA